MSEPQISTNPAEAGNANLIYILYLIGLASGGLTTIVGLVMAYIAQDDAPDWLKSHYRNQIHVFWKFIVYWIICFMLIFLIIGIPLMFVLAIWYIVRIVKGMQRLARGEPYPDPGSWGF